MPIKNMNRRRNRHSFNVNKQEAANTNGVIKKDTILEYVDRVANSGMGKKKSLEFIKKFIINQEDPTLYDFTEPVLDEN